MLPLFKMIIVHHYSPSTRCPLYWPEETAELIMKQTSSNLLSQDRISSSVSIWATLSVWHFFYWLRFRDHMVRKWRTETELLFNNTPNTMQINMFTSSIKTFAEASGHEVCTPLSILGHGHTHLCKQVRQVCQFRLPLGRVLLKAQGY